MQAKLREKLQAQELRRQGKSLRAISRRLCVSKSSVSVWCRGIIMTPDQIEVLKSRLTAAKLGALANKLKREAEVSVIRKQAARQFPRFQASEIDRLKDIGTVMYWAEGSKRKKMVDFTNSDPEMIRLAMLWFRKVCLVREEKFRIAIYYHSGQNEMEMKQYWSQITGVPLNQFYKSMFKKEGTGFRRNILYNGTCKIVVCDGNLLHKILTWIDQLHLA